MHELANEVGAWCLHVLDNENTCSFWVNITNYGAYIRVDKVIKTVDGVIIIVDRVIIKVDRMNNRHREKRNHQGE